MLANLSIHEHAMVERRQERQRALEAVAFAGQAPATPLQAATLPCDRSGRTLDWVGLQPETARGESKSRWCR